MRFIIEYTDGASLRAEHGANFSIFFPFPSTTINMRTVVGRRQIFKPR
jgi:hypothetical protein